MAIPDMPGLKDAQDQLNPDWLERLLRYQSNLPQRLEKLLLMIATYLPKGLGRRLMEAPTTETQIVALNGTVMFADIDGFTALAERFSAAVSEAGAEEVTELVNRFLALLIHAATPYGGDLQKFGGDAGLLLFTGENHALRAVAAALKTQRAMEALAEVETSLGRFPLQIAIGIASGPLVTVGLGTPTNRKWLLTGPPLRAMGQAQQVAPPGGVVLHTSAYGQCDQVAQCTPLDAPQLHLVSAGELPESDFHDLAMPALPQQLDDVQKIRWLLTRLDALAPYLDPGLLARLTTLSTLEHFQLWSEHRQVTILMIGLEESSYIADCEDRPEALQAAVERPNAHFVKARNIIRTYDGIVNKIGIGPEGAYLMVLFGAPQAHEDDPLRAVLAALELQERSERPLRMGINTGFVFAGDVGTDARREYTVMGDEVNLAYRLMNNCEPGQVWLGPHTAHHSSVSRRVKSEAGAPQHFKGRQDPVRPFVAREVRDLFVGEDLGELPLVGRAASLKTLRKIVKTAKSGEPQVMVLHGDAGSGKSRLVRSISEEAREDGFLVYVGNAPSYSAHLPYAAWEQLLRALFHLDDCAPDKQSIALHEALAHQGQDMWAALIAPLVGLDITPSPEVEGLSPELRETQRQAVLRSVLAEYATQQPLILVLENAHWMPSPSLRLVESLMREPPDGSLLLIVTYRDEESALETWGLPARTLDLALPPLSSRAMRALAQYAAGAHNLPVEVKRWIVRRGEGLPLFAIEAVRALRTAGLLKKEGKDWVLVRPLEEAPLPETTYGLIQSRIDQLEPPSRHLLRAATAVGEQMTVPMLVAGYGEEPRSLVKQRLSNLTPMGLIYGDPERETLVFQQPLVREVARRGLPHRIRRQIHHRLSEYLYQQREQATSNWLALLAHHAFEGQRWQLAVRANLDLGSRALDNYLTEQAAQAFQRVLASLDTDQIKDIPTEIEAHHLLGETLTIQGEYTEALHHLNTARELLPAAPSTIAKVEELAHLEYHTASTLESQGELEDAFRAVERGLALPHVKETLEGARLYLRGGSLFYKQGNYDQGRNWSREAIEVARNLPGTEARRVQAQALYALAPLEYQQGHLEAACTFSEESLAIYRETHDLMGEVSARTNLLLVHLSLGKWDQAVKHGELALRLARRIHYAEGEARVAANLGEVYRYRGEFEAARQAYQRALKIAQDRGIVFGEAVMEMNLGAVAIREESWDEAKKHLARAESLSRELGSEVYLPEILRYRAEIAHELDNITRAFEQCQQALQIAKTQGATAEVAPLQRLLAEIHLSRDDCPAAATALQQAQSATIKNQDPYGAARLLLTEARYLQQCETPEQSVQRLEEAREAFDQLGAAGDLVTVKRLYEEWAGN